MSKAKDEEAVGKQAEEEVPNKAEKEVANRAELEFVALVEKLEMEELGEDSAIVDETRCNSCCRM